MIWFREEGASYRVGINISYSFKNNEFHLPWVALAWVWMDLPTRMLTVYRLRLRFTIRPRVLMSVNTVEYQHKKEPLDIQYLLEDSGLLRILKHHAGEFGNGMFDINDYPEVTAFVDLITKENNDVKAEHRHDREIP